ncbi:hypothetical protein EBBID32_870 [Sphingobium indicum BiD32]|uniref:Uncharacterized protein n=1 Tax=Sphingobium indicum BiD32 TaxID=1301087 RepID=N1MG74_9SPHN|nr:hypothetical protein EBBID32_870 [Sphingobium indicum BiD32]
MKEVLATLTSNRKRAIMMVPFFRRSGVQLIAAFPVVRSKPVDMG